MNRTSCLRALLCLLALAMPLAAAGCGDDDDDTSGGDGDADADADADGDADEPDLAASCDAAIPGDCPEGLTCMLELGCVVETCPTAGPGGEHGCPGNGFCYTVDGSGTGYCARVCEVDDDCVAVNPALTCQERSSAEPFGLKICDLP